jgi:hypothetical protein
MKRVLYWIGLLTIAIPVLMPDVLALPFSSDGKVLAQGSAEQNPSLQQYERLDANEIRQLSTKCQLLYIAGEDDATPEGTKVYDCPNTNNGPDITCTEFCVLHIGISDPSKEKTSAPPNSRTPKKDRGSELAPPGKSQLRDQHCTLLRDSSQGTKVFDCGDNLVLLGPHDSIAMLPLGDQQKGEDQRSDNQQKDGGQRSDDQQQDGGQQGGSDRGYGCAARG